MILELEVEDVPEPLQVVAGGGGHRLLVGVVEKEDARGGYRDYRVVHHPGPTE